MAYTMTLRRRREDGSLEEAVFDCNLKRHIIRREDEIVPLEGESLLELILDTEIQTNGVVLESPRPTVRMWLNG